MFVCGECGELDPRPGVCAVDGGRLAPVDHTLGTDVARYRIARKLGQGGMGAVYLGIRLSIGGRVAIKVLSDQCADDLGMIERFFAEARAVNLIRHENIVDVLDLGWLPDGRPFIVMELVDGQTLGHIVRRTRAPLGGIASVAIELLSALDAAHAIGIVHRDFKPDNVLITPTGHAKVLDFGIAKLARPLAHARTQTGAFLGTPAYMSPEQVADAATVDGRADIYAAGVLLFEAVTSRLPFTGSTYELMRAHAEDAPPSARALRPDLPPAFEQVIFAALEKDPARRFQRAAHMAAALRDATRELGAEQWHRIALVATSTPIAVGTPMAGGVVTPSVTAPSVVAPSVAPSVVAPSVVAPSVTAPSVVAPSVTAPSVARSVVGVQAPVIAPSSPSAFSSPSPGATQATFAPSSGAVSSPSGASSSQGATQATFSSSFSGATPPTSSSFTPPAFGAPLPHSSGAPMRDPGAAMLPAFAPPSSKTAFAPTPIPGRVPPVPTPAPLPAPAPDARARPSRLPLAIVGIASAIAIAIVVGVIARSRSGDPNAGSTPNAGGNPKAGRDPNAGGNPKSGSGPKSGSDPKSGSGPKSGGGPKSGSATVVGVVERPIGARPVMPEGELARSLEDAKRVAGDAALVEIQLHPIARTGMVDLALAKAGSPPTHYLFVSASLRKAGENCLIVVTHAATRVTTTTMAECGRPPIKPPKCSPANVMKRTFVGKSGVGEGLATARYSDVDGDARWTVEWTLDLPMQSEPEPMDQPVADDC